MINYRLNDKEIDEMSCIRYNDSQSLPAVIFTNFPPLFKRRCVQIGNVAGLMAKYAQANMIPEDLTRDEYANAVRYGSIYHDIGAFPVPNQYAMYPDAGELFMRENLENQRMKPAERRVILETVHGCKERYDGGGYPDSLSGEKVPLHAMLCAIAEQVGSMMNKKRFVRGAMKKAQKAVEKNTGRAFSPSAAECFKKAYSEITELYQRWAERPPVWKNEDIRPLNKPIEKMIG